MLLSVVLTANSKWWHLE